MVHAGTGPDARPASADRGGFRQEQDRSRSAGGRGPWTLTSCCAGIASSRRRTWSFRTLFIAERLFVLVPLLELDPDCADPRSGEPYREARAALEKDAGGGGGVYLHRAGEYTGPSNTEA